VTFSNVESQENQLISTVLVHGRLQNEMEYHFEVPSKSSSNPYIGRYTRDGWLVKGKAGIENNDATNEQTFLLTKSVGFSVENKIISQAELDALLSSSS
jgi:hypothetical protein